MDPSESIEARAAQPSQDARATATHRDEHWGFLSSHALVLLALIRDPGRRVREVAQVAGLDSRSVPRILKELEAAGYLTRTRRGRHNHYEFHLDRPMHNPLLGQNQVGSPLRLARRKVAFHTRRQRARRESILDGSQIPHTVALEV